MIDVAGEYITARLVDLDEMLAVYDQAKEKPPVDLLARRAELLRMAKKIKEYEYVQEADS